MKRKNGVSIVIYIILAGMVAMMAQSCNSSKKCGCGEDLNGVYKVRKRHRYS